MSRRRVVLCAALALALGGAAAGSGHGEPGAGSPAAPAVHWGGRAFAGTAELRQWLVSRGIDYRAWRAAHRLAAQRLDTGARLPERDAALGVERALLPVAAAQAARSSAARVAPPPAADVAAAGRPGAAFLVPLGAGLAAALLLLAGGALVRRRVEAGAAALSVAFASVVGVLVALTT